MANEPKSQPWWINTNKETLSDRVDAVQKVNDPTIMSDDVLRWSKVALVALLAFTTLLSGFSYFKFFEKSFGFGLALAMALLLACIIEFGKNWGFLRVLRIPFFHGWGHIWSTVANTILWGGLLALAVVTFSASVYNSTKGAQQLSLLLGHERNATTFQPNTADIDAQITATQSRIEETRKIKWRGTTTVDATRAIKADTRVLENLQQQRAARMQQQRADYEKEAGIKDGQNQFTAGNLMAVGGWVELLQIILMFVRVSAERALEKTAQERRGTPSKITYPTGQPTQTPSQRSHYNQTRFFFNRDAHTGNVHSAAPSDTVPQPAQTVAQHSRPSGVFDADAVLENARQALQRDLPNFGRRDARASTVAGRIHEVLTNLANTIRRPGFTPSRETGIKFYEYARDVVFPKLKEHGHPYEYARHLLDDLARIVPEQPQPAA